MNNCGKKVAKTLYRVRQSNNCGKYLYECSECHQKYVLSEDYKGMVTYEDYIRVRG